MSITKTEGGTLVTGKQDIALFSLLLWKVAVEGAIRFGRWPNRAFSARNGKRIFGLKPRATNEQLLAAILDAIEANRAG